ncbi:MAG: hypothetical protein EA001_04365 [Oscillatoriales cyanobacterium]|nr:MAG: hypothetical protein EA001_04365 [Oscillatoriales cyanobacterium]
MSSLLAQLERYTQTQPAEVWLVHAIVEGEPDRILVFKGFSSSLMRPTAFDPDVPLLPPDATIESIDRLQAPFNPDSPQYLDQGLSVAEVEHRLNTGT